MCAGSIPDGHAHEVEKKEKNSKKDKEEKEEKGKKAEDDDHVGSTKRPTGIVSCQSRPLI